MSDIERLITQLKQQLKSADVTYAQVAAALNLSEASVKRLFATTSFTLQRIEQICELLNLTLFELVAAAESVKTPIPQLTLEQEQHIVGDEKLILVCYLVLNHWTFEQIIEEYLLEAAELISLLVKLDRMQLIELLPNNRIRLLTSRDFQWITNGPIEHYFLKKVKHAFLDSRFSQSNEQLRFISGVVSESTVAKIIERLGKTRQEIEVLIDRDRKTPLDQKQGFSALLACRPWEFEQFARFKR